MEAVNRSLRYLKTTPGKGLMFRKIDRRCIEAHTNFDWVWYVFSKSTLGIVRSCGAISYLGGVSSKGFWPEAMLKLSTGLEFGDM